MRCWSLPLRVGDPPAWDPPPGPCWGRDPNPAGRAGGAGPIPGKTAPSRTRNTHLNQIDRIFERLRSGVVPDGGLDAFAVGIEAPGRAAPPTGARRPGTGCFKFLRSGYGCGKTFIAAGRSRRPAARLRGRFVVISDNDLHFHKFDELYRKVMQELSTAWCESRHGDILDRWIAGIEEALVSAGVDEDAPTSTTASRPPGAGPGLQDRREGAGRHGPGAAHRVHPEAEAAWPTPEPSSRGSRVPGTSRPR